MNRRVVALSLCAFLCACNKGKSSDTQSPPGTNGGGTGDPGGGGNGTDTGTGGGPGRLRITGNVPGDADAAVAFTVSGTQIGGVAAGAPVTPITGGQLALEIGGAALGLDGTPSSTVVMVMKSGETPLDSFETMTFVGAPAGDEQTLVKLATSEAKVDAIDLGALQMDADGDLVGETQLGTEQFAVEAEAIAETAKVDDAIRILKNQYANTQTTPSGATQSMAGVLEFYWQGNPLAALDQEAAPTGLQFLGWSPALHVDRDDFTFEALCDTAAPAYKPFVLEIPAPGAKRDAASAYETSLTNAGATINPDNRSCGAGPSYIAGGTASEPGMFMNFGSGTGFQAPIPTGTWTVKLAGAVVGKFDLALAYPMVPDPTDAAKTVPRVYVPSIKVTRDAATSRVQKVEMWLNLYDKATNSYARVTKYDTIRKTIESVSFGIEANLGTDRSNGVLEGIPPEQSRTFPADGEPWVIQGLTRDWRIKSTDLENCPDPTGYYRVDLIGIDYIMYGNRYKFNFLLPTDHTATCS